MIFLVVNNLKIKFSTKSIKDLVSNGTNAKTQQEQVNHWDQFFAGKKPQAPPPAQQQNEFEGMGWYARGTNEEVILDSSESSIDSAMKDVPAMVEATNSNESSNSPTEAKTTSATQEFSDDSLFEVEIGSSEKDHQDSW